MTYSLKDIEAVEDAFRRIRPEAILERTDYDFGLSVRLGMIGFILFKPADQSNPEQSCTVEEAEMLAFFLGENWTPAEIAKMAERDYGSSKALLRKQAVINRVH